MPTKSLERWNRDGSYLKEQFETAGYEVELTYSDNDVTQQVNDIENLISDGVSILIIAAIDGESLTNVLDSADQAGIPVIAYDRLIMLPKDYINYMLTGVHCTDVSDASGMLLLDVKNKRWSSEMMDICGVRESQLARIFESYEPVGTLKPETAKALDLPESVVVCAGAGDNAAAAVGTATVGDGRCNISLGTSGTIFISSRKFGVDPHNALHAFAHADGSYHLMGCMYEIPLRHRDNSLAYWMLLAVQGLTAELVSHLGARDASELLRWFRDAYPRFERMPAQKKVLSALKARA